jgi:hypothetical protein
MHQNAKIVMVKVENGNQGIKSFMKKTHRNLWNILYWGRNKNEVLSGEIMDYTKEELYEISRLSDEMLMKLYKMDRSGRLLYLFIKKLSAKSRMKAFGIEDKYTPFVVSKDEHKKINSDLSGDNMKCYNCLLYLDAKDTWQCDNTSGSECYLEDMWVKFKKDYLNGRPLIIINNFLYLNPDIERVRRNNPYGMLNDKFNIKFNNGTEIITNGLYRIGTIPVHHRDVLCDNAVFN